MIHLYLFSNNQWNPLFGPLFQRICKYKWPLLMMRSTSNLITRSSSFLLIIPSLFLSTACRSLVTERSCNTLAIQNDFSHYIKLWALNVVCNSIFYVRHELWETSLLYRFARFFHRPLRPTRLPTQYIARTGYISEWGRITIRANWIQSKLRYLSYHLL